jgi:hypothetical protein
MSAERGARACYDSRCAVRETCRLWTARDDPGFAVRCMTWRAHWRCHDSPCDSFVAMAGKMGDNALNILAKSARNG